MLHSARDARASILDRWSVVVVAVGATLWALDPYFRGALVHDGLSAAEIVLVENFIICLLFLPFVVRVVAESRRLSTARWIAMAAIAIGPQAFATVFFTASFSQALNHNAIAESYLLLQVQPLVAIALAWLILRERPQRLFWPLAILAIVAVYLVVFAPDVAAPLTAVQHGRLSIALLALVAAVLWASGTVLGRFALEEVSFITTSSLRFALAVPVLLAIMLATNGAHGFAAYGASQLPPFLGVALIPGFAAMLIYYRGLQSTPASMATLAETLYPVAATLIASAPAPLGFAQPLYPAQVVGTVLLMVAVVTLNVTKSRDLVGEPRPHELHPARSAIVGVSEAAS